MNAQSEDNGDMVEQHQDVKHFADDLREIQRKLIDMFLNISRKIVKIRRNEIIDRDHNKVI